MRKRANLSKPARTDKRQVRCSSLPLLFSCGAAVLNPDGLTRVGVEHSAAELGTLIHAAIQHTVETGVVDFREIEARFSEEDVDRARYMFKAGLYAVEQARQHMAKPVFEVEVDFDTAMFHVTGHVDILDMGDKRASILDFKTGRTRDDHFHQLAGYAAGAWAKAGCPEKYEVKAAYVYLESGESTTYTFSVADIRAWIKRLDAVHGGYVVNRRCVYCPLHNSCPALRDHLTGCANLLTGETNSRTFMKMSMEDRGRLATAMKLATDAAARIKDFIREKMLRDNIVELPLGNGDAFRLVMARHRYLLTSKALPVVTKHLTKKQLMDALKINLSSVLTAASSDASPGMRGAIRQKVEDELEKAGAVITVDTPQMRTVYAGAKLVGDAGRSKKLKRK